MQPSHKFLYQPAQGEIGMSTDVQMTAVQMTAAIVDGKSFI
jgi:hypothetical protein